MQRGTRGGRTSSARLSGCCSQHSTWKAASASRARQEAAAALPCSSSNSSRGCMCCRAASRPLVLLLACWAGRARCVLSGCMQSVFRLAFTFGDQGLLCCMPILVCLYPCSCWCFGGCQHEPLNLCCAVPCCAVLSRAFTQGWLGHVDGRPHPVPVTPLLAAAVDLTLSFQQCLGELWWAGLQHACGCYLMTV